MRRTDKRYGSSKWKALTRAVQQRDLFRCQYCNAAASYCADHVVPVVHGGDFWAESNLVAACRSCNVKRRYDPDWRPPTRPVLVADPPAGTLATRRVVPVTDYTPRKKPRIG